MGRTDRKTKRRFTEDLNTKHYSKKAREKLADSLFSISTNVLSAILISIVIAPMVAAFKALATPEDDGIGFFKMFWHVEPYEGWAFLLTYGVALFVGIWARKAAMRMYTELHPDGNPTSRRA